MIVVGRKMNKNPIYNVFPIYIRQDIRTKKAMNTWSHGHTSTKFIHCKGET